MSEEKKKIDAEEVNEEEEQEVKVKGGILMFRTEEDGIVYQPYENLSIVDLTLFAEYLNQLKDVEWAKRLEGEAEDEA